MQLLMSKTDAIAFEDDGKTAYISNQGAGTVSVIALLSKVLIKNISVGVEPNGMVIRKMPSIYPL
jgi:YVTN family beta-propeller protein